MKKVIIAFCISATGVSFADKTITDNSMAAAEKSEHGIYEDRGSFGPYIEFNNIKMSNVTYSYKVHDLKYNIDIDNSYIYGASGTLPLTEWFDIYLMAGYQYLGVSHHPRNPQAVYGDFEALCDEYIDPPLDTSDIDGRHHIHTALFQFGFDFALPLIASYNHQYMLKFYAFAGGLFGKTFFSDDTEFLSPVLYGYAYGIGMRMAWHGFFVSTGFRSSHEYFHTYFERRLSDNKNGDEFMLDYDVFFQPFLSIGITLF